MKKVLKNPIFMFILGSIIFGGIGVFASEIFAADIKYKNTNVKSAIDDLYAISDMDLPNSQTYSNFITNSTREVNNIISLNDLGKGDYICSSYYAASSWEPSSTRGTISTVAYEITGCSISDEYDVNGHWNAANDSVSGSVYTSTMTRDVRFYCKIEDNDTDLSINYKPSSRATQCSVSLYLSCTKVK